MYIGKINKIADCKELSKADITAIEEFLKNNDLKKLEVGKYPLNENNRVMIQQYDTKPKNGRFEAHRKYADIQVVVDGEELFSVVDKKDCSATDEYNAEKDVEHFEGKGEDIVLSSEGDADCVLFMPGELHAPGLCVTAPSPVKKAVFKILINK